MVNHVLDPHQRLTRLFCLGKLSGCKLLAPLPLSALQAHPIVMHGGTHLEGDVTSLVSSKSGRGDVKPSRRRCRCIAEVDIPAPRIVNQASANSGQQGHTIVAWSGLQPREATQCPVATCRPAREIATPPWRRISSVVSGCALASVLPTGVLTSIALLCALGIGGIGILRPCPPRSKQRSAAGSGVVGIVRPPANSAPGVRKDMEATVTIAQHTAEGATAIEGWLGGGCLGGCSLGGLQLSEQLESGAIFWIVQRTALLVLLVAHTTLLCALGMGGICLCGG